LIVKNFAEMMKKVKSASPGDLFVVSGEEYYQSNRLLDVFCSRGVELSFEPVRIVPDDLKEVNLSALFSEASLFSPGKFVVIGEVDKLSRAQKSELDGIVSGGFEHIVFCRTAGRKPSNMFMTKMERAGTAFVCWEPFADRMWKWVGTIAAEEGISFTRDGSQAAEAIASGKLERLGDVVKRTALYHGSGSVVDSQGVYDAVLGSAEATAFQFTAEVLSGKKGAAMSSLSVLINSGEEPIRLLALLYSQWRQTAAARELLQSGISTQAAAKRLGIPSFVWRTVETRAVRRVNYATSEILECFAAADYALKTGSDALASIASVVLSLTSTGK